MNSKKKGIPRVLQDLLKKLIDPEHENFSLIIWSVIAIILGALTLNAFVDLTQELFAETLEPVDTAIFEYIWRFRSDGMTTFMRGVTWLGTPFGYLVIIAVLAGYLYFAHANWRYTLQVLSVIVLSGLVNVILKKWINRSRPLGEHLVEVYSLSYPSGHAMGAMAFYGFLTYITLTNVKRPLPRYLLVTFFVLMILLIGISRIYLGVHFPTDVAAGFLAGLFWVALCILIFNLITIYRRRRHKNRLELQ